MTTNPIPKEELIFKLFSELESATPKHEPKKKICILSTPRSGSTYFCKMLESTTRFGRPEEWLSPMALEVYFKRLGTSRFDLRRHLHNVLTRTASENGVFSINMQLRQFIHWKTHGFDPLSMGFDRIIYLERKDKISQAYSLAKARLTDQWYSTQTAKQDYDPKNITNAMILEALHSIGGWEDYFETHLAARTDMLIAYEELIARPSILDDVLQLCGVEASVDHDPASPTSIQRTDGDVQRIGAFRAYLGLPTKGMAD